jgi:hypothetical protein
MIAAMMPEDRSSGIALAKFGSFAEVGDDDAKARINAFLEKRVPKVAQPESED